MFEFLFGPNNPTKNWRRANDLQLDFDLELGSLNGVRLGEPMEAISFLGPIEDRSALHHYEFGYFSRGLSVCCDNDDKIYQFEVIQRDNLSSKYQPYPGRIHYRGAELFLAQLTEEKFIREFGSPYWRNQDEDEVILFYEFGMQEWQVEFDLNGSFNRITITTPPLLADELQRKAYGVTESWPPTSPM